MQGWFRTKGAARYCGVSDRTLWQWLKSGLRHSKVGGCVLIKQSWLDEFIENQERESESDLIANEVLAGIQG